MNLTPESKQAVVRWVKAGVSLADIQKRLAAEYDLHLTYRDTRFLVDDLDLDLPAPPPPPPAPPAPKAAAPAPAAKPAPEKKKGLFGLGGGGGGKKPAPAPVEDEEPEDFDDPVPFPGAAGPLGGGGAVKVELDRLAQPGMMVSGEVTFSDGQKAKWFVDGYGRFGVAPLQKGYQPSQADLQQFQLELDRLLQARGL